MTYDDLKNYYSIYYFKLPCFVIKISDIKQLLILLFYLKVKKITQNLTPHPHILFYAIF